MSDGTFKHERSVGVVGTAESEEVRALSIWRYAAWAAALAALAETLTLREWFAIKAGDEAAQVFAEYWLTLGSVASVLLGVVVFFLLTLRRSARTLAAGMTQELRLSADWFERLFDYAPVPYLLLDAGGGVTRANKAALRLFDVSSAEPLVGKHLSELVVPTAAQDVEQYLAYFASGLPVTGKEFSIGSEEDERWVLFSLEILGERGPQQGGLATLVDISERRALESAKTEFVSVAAHQLRGPLSNMSWQGELLLGARAGALTDEQRALAEKMYRGTRHLAGVVDLLLNAARLETGTLTASSEPVDLCALGAHALAALEQTIISKRLAVETSFDERLHSFTIDPRLVDTIISNLLSNAFKYTPEGGRVVFTLATIENGGVKIMVRDSGAGIPADAQPYIFTKLFRAKNARQADPGGLGLGLYMVRKIVDLLGGEISFTSEEGVGTEFVVTIPQGKPVETV